MTGKPQPTFSDLSETKHKELSTYIDINEKCIWEQLWECISPWCLCTCSFLRVLFQNTRKKTGHIFLVKGLLELHVTIIYRSMSSEMLSFTAKWTFTKIELEILRQYQLKNCGLKFWKVGWGIGDCLCSWKEIESVICVDVSANLSSNAEYTKLAETSTEIAFLPVGKTKAIRINSPSF